MDVTTNTTCPKCGGLATRFEDTKFRDVEIFCEDRQTCKFRMSGTDEESIRKSCIKAQAEEL